MLDLYHSIYSTCSQKVRFCLAEKGLDWTDRHIDLFREQQLEPEYLKLNPNGVVPTLLHDGRPVTESSVIVQYLDEVFPEPSLSPADPYERARMMAWIAYINEIPTSYIRIPSVHSVFSASQTQVSTQTHRQNSERRPVRKYLFRKLGAAGFPKEEQETAMVALRDTVVRVERALSQGEWIAGNFFSQADIVLIPTIDRLEDLELHWLWQDMPRFGSWWQSVKERPAYGKTFPDAARLSHYIPDFGAVANRELGWLRDRVIQPS